MPPDGTRPTSERAREALFNTLATLLDFDGARVLDLFAGSGAVGLEALSRGAARPSFVESDRAARPSSSAQRRRLGLPGATAATGARSRPTSAAPGGRAVRPGLRRPAVRAAAEAVIDALLDRAGRRRVARAGRVVVVERSARGPEPVWPRRSRPIKQKRYGEGSLWYGRATMSACTG